MSVESNKALPPPGRWIRGRITDSQGLPVADVQLNLEGGEFRSDRTNASGNYAFESVPSQLQFTLRPSKPGFRFDPNQVQIDAASADAKQDFSATVEVYELAGVVKDSQGLPLSGVTLTLSGTDTRTVESDRSGGYSFPGVHGAKSYTLTPQKTGFTFTPPSLPIVYLCDDLKHSFFGSSQADRDKAPSQWTVLNDYSKTIITLASGLLVLSITFSSQLTDRNNDFFSHLLLTLTWTTLALTIVAGVRTNVFVIQFLRNNIEGDRAVFWANGSYLTLAVAGILFLVFGSYVIWFPHSKQNLGDPIDQAKKTLASMGATANWDLQSLQWDQKLAGYHLIFIKQGTGDQVELQFDPVTNQFSKIPKTESDQPPSTNANQSPIANQSPGMSSTTNTNVNRAKTRTNRHRIRHRRNRR